MLLALLLVRYLGFVRYIKYLGFVRYIKYLGSVRYIKYLGFVRYIKYLGFVRYIKYLGFVLTNIINEEAGDIIRWQIKELSFSYLNQIKIIATKT